MWFRNTRTPFWLVNTISIISVSSILIIWDRIGGENLFYKSGEHSYYRFQIFTWSRRALLVLPTTIFLFAWQPAKLDGWKEPFRLFELMKNYSKTRICQSCNSCSDFLLFSCSSFPLVHVFLHWWGFPGCCLVPGASASLVSVDSPCARRAPCPRSSRVETERLASAATSSSASTVRATFSCTSRGGVCVSLEDAGHLVLFIMLSRSKRIIFLEFHSVRGNWKFRWRCEGVGNSHFEVVMLL